MSEYPRSPAAPPSIDGFLGTLRALAEPTRLRLALLLCSSELTVTEISHVIGQSQPRTSRHLRLLLDADILERSPEGAHVFYRVCDGGDRADLVRQLADRVPAGDPLVAADAAALERVLAARVQAAATCLRSHDDEVAALRSLQVAEADVEHAMLELIGATEPIERLLDIGTGTGRILELLAPVSERSVGLDVSRDMVAAARAKLGEARLSRASVRHGDLHRPPFEAASFDVAVMHHVLHLLDDPGGAVADAARLLRPGGRLLVADFAPHQLELLREQHGHRHLGIDDRDLRAWAAGRAGSRSRASAPCARHGPGRAAHRQRSGCYAPRRARGDAKAGGPALMAVTVSFEFFPPRTPEAEQRLLVYARSGSRPWSRAFVSVTYGAGGKHARIDA
jgi:SAM-dependent methyltransferase